MLLLTIAFMAHGGKSPCCVPARCDLLRLTEEVARAFFCCAARNGVPLRRSWTSTTAPTRRPQPLLARVAHAPARPEISDISGLPRLQQAGCALVHPCSWWGWAISEAPCGGGGTQQECAAV